MIEVLLGIKSYSFLKPFQRQVTSQYKNQHEIVLNEKKFKKYVPKGNQALSLEKFIAPWGRCPFPQGTWAFSQRKQLGFFPKENSLFLGKLFLLLVQIYFQDISFILQEFHFVPHGTYIVPQGKLLGVDNQFYFSPRNCF